MQQKIADCTWMYLKECVSLISERPATVSTAFRDLPMKMCDQLGGRTHWISFVLLVFVSHWLSLFHQDRYCNLNKSFGLMSHDICRAVPEYWSYCFSIFVECGTLPSISTFSESFSCSQNGPRYGLELIASVQGNTSSRCVQGNMCL